jgi:hypothetical protein
MEILALASDNSHLIGNIYMVEEYKVLDLVVLDKLKISQIRLVLKTRVKKLKIALMVLLTFYVHLNF